jgi:hypothetical protein
MQNVVILRSFLMLYIAVAFSALSTPTVFAASYLDTTSWGDRDSVRILAKAPSSRKKIVEGFYNVGQTGDVMEVKGRKYRYSLDRDTGKWEPISNLTYIRKGVFRLEGTYWCLSPTPSNSKGYSCTASGWKEVN